MPGQIMLPSDFLEAGFQKIFVSNMRKEKYVFKNGQTRVSNFDFAIALKPILAIDYHPRLSWRCRNSKKPLRALLKRIFLKPTKFLKTPVNLLSDTFSIPSPYLFFGLF